jgi:hypothetical protein
MGLGCQLAQSGIPRKGVARTMYGLLGGREAGVTASCKAPAGEASRAWPKAYRNESLEMPTSWP